MSKPNFLQNLFGEGVLSASFIPVYARLRAEGRHDDASRVLHHFVLVDYLCWPIGGELSAGTDVAEAVLAEPADLPQYNLTEKATQVIERVQRDGTCWCGPTAWQGRTAMRISVSSWATTEEDVDRSVAAILRAARES